MSVRHTTRKLTGSPLYHEPEVVLGFRDQAHNQPGVTVHFGYDTYGCFHKAEILERLIEDLQAALEHLRGQALS